MVYFRVQLLALLELLYRLGLVAPDRCHHIRIAIDCFDRRSELWPDQARQALFDAVMHVISPCEDSLQSNELRDFTLDRVHE